MTDALFYDESEFDVLLYAQVFDIPCTKLGLCIAKGLTTPERHDYGTVYFLVSEEREKLFNPVLDNFKKAGFKISIQRELLSYKGQSQGAIRRQFRIDGIFKPFDDVARKKAIDEILRLEEIKQERDRVAGLIAGDSKPVSNALDGLLESTERKVHDNRRKRKSLL